MKVGIVTQPLMGNYGGILQNFALQQVLKTLGHDPVTLDYIFGFKGNKWVFAQIKQLVKKCLGRKGDWLLTYAPKRSNQIINEFVDEYIQHTNYIWNDYTPNLITDYGLDAIVVGSDQVWRPKYNPKLDSSFLSFTNGQNIKRIAYAASFGSRELEFTEIQFLMAKKQLGKFDAISVREYSGIELVKNLGYDAQLVLDPTILLGRDGFKNSLNLTKIGTMNHLGTYILDPYEKIDVELDRLKNLANCTSIISMSENVRNIGPKEWLETIGSSKIFITDSFHGTVFCILFHIPFYTVVNAGRGSDRFISLLQSVGLGDRLKDSFSDINITDNDIDWDRIDSELEIQRCKSLEFLIKALA